MGSRGWMIPVENNDDVRLLRTWLANANLDGGSVSFVGLCKRSDGSVWALVNSDGSHCIDNLVGYGYSSDQRIRLLGDYPKWDRRGSPLGPLSEATYSPYLDARPDEFVSHSDWRSRIHWPPSYVIGLDSEDDRKDLLSLAVQIGEDASVRCIPQEDGDCYLVEGTGAVYFGTALSHVDQEALARLQRKYAVVVNYDQVPANARRGFVLKGVAHLWNDETGDYEEFKYLTTARGGRRRH